MAWSLSAVWMADMAEALEHVRHEDGAPRRLTPAILLEFVGALREDRDGWKLRAERAEYVVNDERRLRVECAADAGALGGSVGYLTDGHGA
jgi:hypothetical protein